jgi:hypothetical protein
MKMDISGELRVDDVRAALRLHSQEARRRVRLFAPLMFLLAGCCFYVFTEHDSAILLFVSLGLAGCALAFLYLFEYKIPYIVSTRIYQQAGGGPITVIVDDEGYRDRTSLGEGFTKWEGFKDYKANAQGINLYMPNNSFKFVSRRWLTDDQEQMLRQFLNDVVRRTT